jgi:hypothetical protein
MLCAVLAEKTVLWLNNCYLYKLEAMILQVGGCVDDELLLG